MASEIEYVGAAGQAIGLPFSPVVAFDNLVFCSGQVGFMPNTSTLVEGGIEAQTQQTMENLRANLELAGSSLAHVVKILAFLAEPADFPLFNATYSSFFSAESFPARSTLVAGFVAPGVVVEIECIAARQVRSAPVPSGQSE
jgi:2-iminobutanoate/2-iminopropanoate deaminase